jgi:hypothetical protein
LGEHPQQYAHQGYKKARNEQVMGFPGKHCSQSLLPRLSLPIS